MRRQLMARCLAPLVLATALLAGCGAGSSGGTASPTSGKADRTADEARAKHIVLAAADVPPEWHLVRTDTKAGVITTSPGCEFLDGGDDSDPESNSSFERGDDTLDASAALKTDSSTAQRDFARLAQAPDLGPCLSTAVKASLDASAAAAGLTVGQVKTERRALPGIGDESFAARSTVTISGPDGDIPFVFELVGVRTGRVLLTLATGTESTPLEESFLSGLARKMADRA